MSNFDKGSNDAVLVLGPILAVLASQFTVYIIIIIH